jgi:NADPH-dependent 2,4-dienoyl-CoA reductase/sulfur reductase-like enzyme/nitrite reductase/ring-hydroxylating ferredoxin subunit
MGDHKAELAGPDFGAGVDVASLADGAPTLGHAAGESVVVVRRGNELHAIGAICTHYSGPLAEGLVVGETVRCPWHHACFDLKTGEAIGGPALNDIPCYEIVRAENLVRVGKKKDAPKRSLSSGPSSVVVVGAGAAGEAAVEALRREGYAGTITFIGDEAPGPVDRPNLSKDYLAGTAPEEWIALRDAAFYSEKQVDFVLGDPAASIDRVAKTVTLQSGKSIAYDALLLTTGASAVRLKIPGSDLDHVHTLRTLADSRAIAARASKGSRAVVIGTSFIGLEVAASLRARGVEVDVVAPEKIPLARVLGEAAGAFVLKLHQDHGVRFHLGEKPKSISKTDVELESGARLSADFVVIGVGVRPRVELAEAAGLRVENGIVVDAHFRTSDPSIFAAGDVARYPDAHSGVHARIEHWVLAEREGQHAARAILGKTSVFRDAPFFWSQHYDVSFSYVGHAETFDRVDIRGSLDARDAALFFWSGEKILAVATLGRDALGLRVGSAMEAGDDAALRKLASA